MSSALREAAQQALEAMDYMLNNGEWYQAQERADALRAALAEDARDWSLLEATQESLREHMAEIQQLRAALAQPATIAEWWAAKQAASGEPVAWIYQNSNTDREYLVWQKGTGGRNWRPLYTAQPAPARAPSSVNPEAHADFVRALHGGKGDLDAWLECYNETEVRAHVLALVHQPAASGAQADLIAGALYDLMGDLTSRDETIRLGATEWATPAADALVAFAAKRGLSLDNPAIADWSKRIAAAAQPVPARVPLTDEQIDRITAEQWGRGLGAPYAAYRAYARAIEAAHGIAPDAQQEPMP